MQRKRSIVFHNDSAKKTIGYDDLNNNNNNLKNSIINDFEI